MTTGVPSGLGWSLGMVKEGSGYGSETAVARWFNVDGGEGFGLKKHRAQSKGVSGQRYLLSGREVLVAKDAVGKFGVDACQSGLGLLFQGSIGSAATAAQQGTTTAYLQQHVPGTTLKGFSYNFQKGLPLVPSGTITPFSYPGSKITSLELSCKLDEIAKINVELDCQFEDTAASLAAVTFPNNGVFHFDQLAVLWGGAVTSSGGVISSMGSPASVTGNITAVSLKVVNKYNTARYAAGSQTKSEPIESDFAEISGEIEIEFGAVADYYTAMAANTVVTGFQVNLTGPVIASTYNYYIQGWVPAIKWGDASPMASSLDVIKVKVPFIGYNDPAGDPAIQWNYMSTDTAV